MAGKSRMDVCARGWMSLACIGWMVALLGGQCAPPMPGGGSSNRLIFTSLSAALLSITGTSPSDVYTVGADPGDGRGPYVLHYDGAAWERLDTGASGDLWWVSVTPIGGAYFMAGEGGLILSYGPDTGFAPFATPGDATVFGVWGGADGSYAWAVGGDLDDPDAGGFIWRYDGTQWAAEDLSGPAPGGLPTLYKVWGRGADDVYVVGRLGTALHYDGSSWSQVPTDTTRTLFTIHGNASAVIAVGGAGDAVIEELEDGEFVNSVGQSLLQLNGIFVTAAGDAASAGNDGTIVERTGTGWQPVVTEFETSWDFHGAWVDPAGGIWAVGGNLGVALDNGMIAYIGTGEINDAVR